MKLKQLIQLSCVSSAALLLAACGYNPQTVKISPTQQCITLQHRMLFANQYNPVGKSNTHNINRQQQYHEQFQSMHCYQILHKARKGEPKK